MDGFELLQDNCSKNGGTGKPARTEQLSQCALASLGRKRDFEQVPVLFSGSLTHKKPAILFGQHHASSSLMSPRPKLYFIEVANADQSCSCPDDVARRYWYSCCLCMDLLSIGFVKERRLASKRQEQLY